MKIVLSCPHCGNTTWIERNDKEAEGAFECGACADLVFTEDMCAKTIEE